MAKLMIEVMTALKSTYVLGLPSRMKKPSPADFVDPSELMTGWMMPPVNCVMIAPNAAPTTTATARSTTLPRSRKSLKPLIMSSLQSVSWCAHRRRSGSPCHPSAQHHGQPLRHGGGGQPGRGGVGGGHHEQRPVGRIVDAERVPRHGRHGQHPP